MQKRRKIGSKLGDQGEKLEAYFKTLYDGSYPKAADSTISKEQSYLQVPLGQAKFLEMLVRIQKPKKILEIGTFRGYSAVFMASAMPKTGKMWTIERDASRYDEIKDLWKRAGVSKKIELIEGQALTILKNLVKKKARFDFLFIDASKEEAIEHFKICHSKLSNRNSVILIDNTLWSGEVADKEPLSNAARHMKSLNQYIFKKHKDSSYILPGWDGMTIVLKN